MTERPSDHLLQDLDTLLATQGQLQFAKDNYDEDQATHFGIALLDFMRVHGMELRRRLAAASEGAQGAVLWCLHLQGPDEVIPAPTQAHAQKAADAINAYDNTGLVRAVAAPWPHSDQSHADDVGKFINEWMIPRGALAMEQLSQEFGTTPPQPQDAAQLARRFHDEYERLAPAFGYETRADTRQFDPESPNGRLMIAVCTAIAGNRDAARDREDAEAFRRIYDLIPNLPVTPEACEQATNALTAFCMEFGTVINDAARGAGAEGLANG